MAVFIMIYGAWWQNFTVFCRLQQNCNFYYFCVCYFNCEVYGLEKKALIWNFIELISDQCYHFKPTEKTRK